MWRKSRLGYVRVQAALAKVEVSVKLESTVPVEDTTENPVVIVGCVN